MNSNSMFKPVFLRSRIGFFRAKSPSNCQKKDDNRVCQQVEGGFLRKGGIGRGTSDRGHRTGDTGRKISDGRYRRTDPAG